MKFILGDMQVLAEIVTETQIQRQFSKLKHDGNLPNKKKS